MLKLTSDERRIVDKLAVPVGTTARMNHESCPAGKDSRRRLYVTHDASGTYLCYCHNCSAGVAFPTGAPRVRMAYSPPITPKGVAAPPPAMKMTTLGELFIKAWGLDPGEEYWCEDGDAQGIVFPFTGGYQIRWLKGSDLKWQTFGDPEYNVHGKDIIVCEDALSARKWLECDNSNGAICLFGAKASKGHPVGVASVSEPLYLVWLDNDQTRIDEVAADIAKKIGTAHSHNVVLVKGGTDPKRYTKGELVNVRDEARKLCGTTPATGQPYHVLEIPIPDQRVRAGLGVKRNPT